MSDTNTSTDTSTFLPAYRHGKRTLSEKQMKLLDLLPECGYDPKKAALMAGYTSNNVKAAIRSVSQELVQAVDELISSQSLIAATTLANIMIADRPIPNIKEKIAVAQDLLDRAGHVKKTVVDVNHEVKGGIFIIPEKKPIDVEFVEAEDIDYTESDHDVPTDS